MSQTCPRCRLISPPSAMRCDCGYDFATGKMESSYVLADAARRPDGGQIGRTAQHDVKTGAIILVLCVVFSAVIFAVTGRVGIAVLPAIGGIVTFTRGRQQQRALREIRESANGSTRAGRGAGQ